MLAVCGGDLSTGTTADVTLTGAATSQPLWLAVGTTSSPTPLFGGMVVPVPTSFLIAAATDALGEYSLVGFAGGGGPATLFVQAIYMDPAQALGFGISNAVQADFLP